MEFTAAVQSAEAKFSVQWGDTVRIHDIYFPYFKLEVRVAERDRERLPNLTHILLYCFEMHPANVWDEFDEEACLRDSKFDGLGIGSILHVSGPVHRRLIANDSPMFGSYDYVVIWPEMHEEEPDVNGSWQAAVTEWLVAEEALRDEGEAGRAPRLVVAWECAWLGTGGEQP